MNFQAFFFFSKRSRKSLWKTNWFLFFSVSKELLNLFWTNYAITDTMQRHQVEWQRYTQRWLWQEPGKVKVTPISFCMMSIEGWRGLLPRSFYVTSIGLGLLEGCGISGSHPYLGKGMRPATPPRNFAECFNCIFIITC